MLWATCVSCSPWTTSTIRSPCSADTARSSSTKWSSTTTCIGSATSEAPRAFSSGWPSKSADARRALRRRSRTHWRIRGHGFDVERRLALRPTRSNVRTTRLVSPPVALAVDVFARILAEVGRADDEDLEALWPGLVASPRAGRDAHRVPFLELDDLVVDFHPPAPAQDYVHLLLRLVCVAVRKAIAGRDALVAQGGFLELERLGRRAELQVRRAVEPRADVLQILLDVPDRERHGAILCASFQPARRSEVERREALGRDVVGGLVGHGSAPVVVDDLDVVPVRVEHERAVVARVVDRALAGRAVVLVARRERGGVERAHRGVLAGGEREVDVLRERPLVPDEREAVVRAGQLHAAGLVVRQAEPGVRGNRRVEAPGGLRVAYAEPQVVDAAVRHGVLAVAVDRLDAVAVGVEQEPAVVRRAVLPARPRRALVTVPRVDARLPERVDLRPVARAEAGVEPAGHRVPGVRRPDVPVLPLDQLGVRMAGLDAQDAQDGAVEALGGRHVRDGDADMVEHPAEATVAGMLDVRHLRGMLCAFGDDSPVVSTFED